MLNWLKPQEAEFLPTIVEKLPTWGHVTIAAYYRLLIPYLLPPSLEKVIYLDCDLILKEDLNNLWKIDVDNQYLLTVQDMGCPLVSSKNGLKTYQELQISPDTPYFNSGVMILNLKKWREDDISFEVINYAEESGAVSVTGIRTVSTLFWLTVGGNWIHAGINFLINFLLGKKVIFPRKFIIRLWKLLI
ncbi:MAG UNVERIFIED_CONTAM: hypothetical protein LVR29_21425 [Microcystis novacekii LVE1205-3]